MRRRDKILLTVGVVLTLLVAARIALPFALERYVNRTLAAVEGYDGRVQDLDLALWRGGIAAEDIRIVRTGAEHSTPFFLCERVDVSIEWKSLLQGSLVAEGEALRPALNLVQARTDEESQLGTETQWPTWLIDYYPFDVNTFRVRNGVVTFRAPGIESEEALTANNVNAVVTNLTNVADSEKETFAQFEVEGTVLDKAPLRIGGSLDPLAQRSTFDVNLALEGVQLPDVNPWLDEFLNVDAQSGSFQLYLELAAADGAFEGYAKPLTQNVEIYGAEDRDEGLLRKAWEGLVEFATQIVENPDEEQVAARVPFSGTIENPDANIWQTIVSVLRNAFVSAFARSLEGSVSIRDVRERLTELGESSGAGTEENEEQLADDEGRKEGERRERRPIERGPRPSGLLL
jgi:hypothetical protein